MNRHRRGSPQKRMSKTRTQLVKALYKLTDQIDSYGTFFSVARIAWTPHEQCAMNARQACHKETSTNPHVSKYNYLHRDGVISRRTRDKKYSLRIVKEWVELCWWCRNMESVHTERCCCENSTTTDCVVFMQDIQNHAKNAITPCYTYGCQNVIRVTI